MTVTPSRHVTLSLKSVTCDGYEQCHIPYLSDTRTVLLKHSGQAVILSSMGHTAPIVPANPGFQLLSFWFADDEGYEPTADDVTAVRNRMPILAWRLMNSSPEPIAFDFCEPDPDEGLVAVLRPDGAVVVQGEQSSFENLDKWAEYVCKKWRLWRDAQRKPAA